MLTPTTVGCYAPGRSDRSKLNLRHGMQPTRQHHDLTSGRLRLRTNVGLSTLLACLMVIAGSAVAQVSAFGEGWSSENQGESASIYYRAFTIYTGEEACEESGRPVELRVPPSPIWLRVSERLYRSESSDASAELVVDAYDSEGRFLSRVPIIVNVIDPSGLMIGRSDWDYIEATKPGEALLRFSWLCSTADGEPISAERTIVVIEN